jgi:hypothetical protein
MELQMECVWRLHVEAYTKVRTPLIVNVFVALTTQ